MVALTALTARLEALEAPRQLARQEALRGLLEAVWRPAWPVVRHRLPQD